MRVVAASLLAVALVPGSAHAQVDTGVIAYTRDADGPAGPGEPTIYVARADGTGERALTTGFAPILTVGDKKLAFSVRTGGAAQQMVASLDSPAAAKQVTTFGNREPEFGPGRYGAFGSAWSLDNRLLALRLQEGSTTTLAMVGADGSGFQRFEFGHLFGSTMAWRSGSEVAIGSDSGLRLVSENGTVVDPPGRQQTDTPIYWVDGQTLAVNAVGGVETLDVRAGTRRTLVSGSGVVGWARAVTGDLLYTTETALSAVDPDSPTPRVLALLPAGAQVRTVLGDRTNPIVELADANGVSAIYVAENGSLRKIADGGNVTLSNAAGLDEVVFGGALPTGSPGATPPPAALPEPGDPVALAHEQGRSTFTVAVPAADAVETGGKALLASLLLTALLMFLLTFPAELFNSTLEEHYDEVRGWFRLKPRAPVVDQPRGKRLAVFAASTLAAALLYSLLDPDFGFDGPSFRLYAGLLAGMVVVTAAFSAAPVAYMRKRYGERGLLRAFPGALAVGAACVLVSRLASFEPGYLYGILGGFAFSRGFSKDEEGRNALVAAGSVLAVSLVAWLLWQPVNDAAVQTHSPGLLLGLGDSTLATVAVGGLQGLVIGLLPLRSLHGYALSRWNRGAWFALYGVVLFLFVHLLLREGGDQTGAPFVTWLVLFVGFGVVSVAFWGYFRFRPSSARTAPP